MGAGALSQLESRSNGVESASTPTSCWTSWIRLILVALHYHASGCANAKCSGQAPRWELAAPTPSSAEKKIALQLGELPQRLIMFQKGQSNGAPLASYEIFFCFGE
uniref:Uncharacterized protein n=1 Tax=Sphaerodactylus townsendi TaxID=933632 RepID=A0ACB8FLW7_9SAUR